MRHCNWTIDQEQNHLSVSTNIDKTTVGESITIPFKTDNQYNIFLNINIGWATVKNILVDYGSNGSIALNKEIFSKLKDNSIIGKTLLEKGFQQSGIIESPINFSREITLSDSVTINTLNLDNIILTTGKTVSIGNGVLSRLKVTIDWNNKILYLKETGKTSIANRSPDFRLGYSTEQGIYIQSIIENSQAYEKGARANMRVTKVDNLDFENDNDFCDYVMHKQGNMVYFQLIDATGQRLELYIDKTILKNN